MSVLYKFSFFCIVLAFLFNIGLDISNPIDISFVLLIIINSFSIFNYSTQPISIFRSVQLFLFFFLSLAPFIQFKSEIIFWGNQSVNNDDYLICNIILFFILLVYLIVYHFFRNRFINFKFFNYHNNKVLKNISKNRLFSLYFISFLCFFITFYNNGFSVLSLLFRGGEFSEVSSSISGPAYLFFQLFIRPLPMIILLSYYLIRKKIDIHVLILGLVAVITTFPLGMARFSVAALYIPFVIIFFPILQRKFNFTFVIIFSLLFLFPFLDNFRRFSSDSKIRFGFNFDMFNEAHFDSYQSIISVVSNGVITYGNQILGVLFFWVPRSFWPNKPIGSGAFMADLTDLDFSNISMNFFAEGFINFGFFGMFLFTFALAYFSAFFDVKFYKKSFKTFLFPLWYYIVVGFTFFILRGDLLSSFAYFMGFTLGFLLIYKVLKN
ncbi:O-antigen polymerase [Cyclobacterium marinum]|uniref:O-antigen polymerase n=1 Tax=Cyclobacterium marinum TaxID=104 RepID=UPI0011ECAAE8|nr:O-antigen polymerase [Cyclobacterium marinum]MBI0400163.1 oligosaccharide repeat unit polymerase [Cyclobacterium marinum]